VSDDRSHLFICHSSKDHATALGVVQFLEEDGLNCWISSRDILPGHNYQESIVTALEHAWGIVFLFSEASSGSGEIRKELSLAGSGDKPVFPLRLSPIAPSGALRYELATRQWIDIFPDRDKSLSTLARTVRQVLAASGAAQDPMNRPSGAGVPAPTGPLPAGAAAPDTGLPVPGTPVVTVGSAEFEALRALLARHIGPIAKIYLQKEAAAARTPEDLCRRLATHVAVSADRAVFLKAAQAELAKRRTR
jgi:hypothetical protein